MWKSWSLNRTFLLSLASLAVLLTLGTTLVKADTIMGGVSYAFWSSPDGSDPANVYDVILTIDTTNATANGTLSSFSVQFTGATDVTFESISDSAGGLTSWTALAQGTNTGSACNSTPSNWWCTSTTSGFTITPGGSGNGVYTFVFDVTMPNGTPLPTLAGIKAFQKSGLSISSDVAIPEPATAALLGCGLVGLAGLVRWRRGFLGA